jgi:predicted lipoprotein with Yx(FWY)xxD motif
MRPTPKTCIALLPVLAVSLTLAACGSSSSSYPSTSSKAAATSSTGAATSSTAAAGSGGASATGVKTASNATLGSTVLVNAQGRTLYHLSGEGNGKFLCTSAACVAAWPPVGASAIGTGLSGLAAIRRPDGSAQLAYNGEPLYTFSGDKAAGEANGQGIKADGGTWSAVVAGAGSASATQTGSSSSEGAAGGSSSGESGSSGGAGGGGGYKY